MLPCGVNPPEASQCAGSQPKYLHQRAGQPALWQGKNSLMSECQCPPALEFLTFWPRSSAPSGGWWWLTASHCPSMWGGAPCIWMMSLSPVVCHMTGMPLLHPPMPPPPPVANFYGIWLARRGRLWCGGGWYLPMTHTCCKKNIGGGGGSLTPK